MFHKRYVRFNEARLGFVVTQPGTGIQRADIVERLLHSFYGTAEGTGDFFVLLVLHRPQILVHNRDGIGKSLRGGFSVAVLVQFVLLLMVAQLVKKALTKITAG